MELFKIFGEIVVNTSGAAEAIEEVGEAAKDATEDIKDFDKETEEVGKTSSAWEKVGSFAQKAGEKITAAGKALLPVSTAATAVLTASAKGASDFEDGMAKMSTLFDTTQYSVEGLSKQFIELSNQTGISATELAEAGYQALSAGQSVEQVSKFVETAGNLSKAGFTSTTTAVDVLTTAMNAYGEKAGTAEEIANKLVRTQNLGKTTVDELASSMGKIIPTASSMGVNIDNLTSAYVALTKQGIATAEATTYTNSMLNELGDSSTTVGKKIKEYSGQSFQELMASGFSLADVLDMLQDYAKQSGKNFNELWGSSEAGKAALSILNVGFEEFNSTVDTMASKTDDVSEAIEKLETPSEQAHKSLTRIKNAGIELGTTLLTSMAPVIETVTEKIEKFTEWFSNLDDGSKQTIINVLLFVAALSPVLLTVGKVVTVGGKMISAFSKIKTAFKLVSTGAKALWAIMAANPIVIVIAVIVALVAAFVVLWNKSESFRNFWKNLWKKVKEAVKTAVDGIKELFDRMKAKFDEAKDKLSAFKDAVKTQMEANKQAVQNAVDKIKSAFDNLKSKATELINKFGEIKDKITEKINGARDAVKSAIDKIKSMFNFSWSLPKIKLPHFSVSGGKAPWGFGGMGSLPSVSVQWYKKAMTEPYVMTQPTIFGVDPSGNIMAGGEAGNEVVYGHGQLMSDIEQASNSSEVVAVLADILKELQMLRGEMYTKIANILNGLGIDWDERELARLVRKYA